MKIFDRGIELMAETYPFLFKSKKEKPSIVVCGHLWVGKSALINVLISPQEVKFPSPIHHHYEYRRVDRCRFYESDTGCKIIEASHNTEGSEDINNADIILFLIDINDSISDTYKQNLKSIKELNKPIILVITKIDQSDWIVTDEKKYAQYSQTIKQESGLDPVFISIRYSQFGTKTWITVGINKLLKTIFQYLPNPEQFKDVYIPYDQTVEEFIQNKRTQLKQELTGYDKDGFTAFHRACAQGNLEKAKNLVVQGSNIKQLTQSGASSLDLAVEKGHEIVAKWLLEQGVNFQLTDNEALHQFTKHFDIEFALLGYRHLKPQYQLIIDYLITSLDLKHWTLNKTAIDPFTQFLQLALFANQTMQTVIECLIKQKALSLIEAFKSYYPIYLVSAIKASLLDSPDWDICVKRMQSYSINNTQFVEPIRLYLDNAITNAVFQWYEILPDKTYIKLVKPNEQKLEAEQKIHAQQLNADPSTKSSTLENTTAAVKPQVYPSFPIKALVALLNFSQELKVDELLANTEKAKGIDSPSWQSWFINNFMSPTDPGYKTVLANFKWETAKRILQTVYGRIRILEALRKGQISNWQAVAGIEEIFKAQEELNTYLNAFKKESVLQSESLAIQLLKDSAIHEFLVEEKYIAPRAHLLALCANTQIPGLDQPTVIEGLKLVADLQTLVQKQSQETQAEMSTYQSLALHLLDKDPLQTLNLLVRTISFIKLLHEVLKIFLQPQLFPLAQLLQPALQQIVSKAKSLAEKLRKNFSINEAPIIRQLPLAKNQPFIHVDKLLEEAIKKEQLGDLLLSPIGNALKNKKWEGCIFTGEKIKVTCPEQEIQGSFNHMAFDAYSFNGCTFRHFSFAQSYMTRCDFNNAQFLDEIELDVIVDAQTASSLLQALRCSRDQQATESKLRITGRVTLAGESEEILHIYGEWIKYVDIPTGINWAQTHQTEDKAAVFEEMPPLVEDSEQNNTPTSQNATEQNSFWSNWLGGLSQFIPDWQTLRQVNQQAYQAAETIYNYMQHPQETITSLHQDAQKVAAQATNAEQALQQTINSLKEKQTELLQEKIKELEKQTSHQSNAHAQAVNLIANRQEIIQKDIENHKTAITILEQKMADIHSYWQEKQRVAAEQQKLLNDPNPAIGMFYQTLLTQLSGVFLALFLIRTKLFNVETGKITDFAKRGGTTSDTKAGEKLNEAKVHEQFGFLRDLAEKAPSLIIKAVNSLERGLDYTLIYSKKLLKLKQAAKMIPGVGGIVEGCLTVAETGADFVLDKKDQQRLDALGQRWQGYTPKNLEKLADFLARGITFAFYEPITLCSAEGGRILGNCAMIRIVVALLNQQLGHQDDFFLEVLIALRSFSISQNNYGDLPNMFGVNFLQRSLPLADPYIKYEIKENDIFQHSGVCFVSTIDKTMKYYYLTNSEKNKADIVGYMLTTEQQWEKTFRHELTPEPANQSRRVARPMRQQTVFIEKTKKSPINRSKKIKSPIPQNTANQSYFRSESTRETVEKLVDQAKQHEEANKQLQEQLVQLEKKLSAYQQHSAINNFGNVFDLNQTKFYQEKVAALKEIFQCKKISSYRFQIQNDPKDTRQITITIPKESKESLSSTFEALGESLYSHLGTAIIKDFSSQDRLLHIKFKTTQYASKTLRLLEDAGLSLEKEIFNNLDSAKTNTLKR